MSKVEELSTIEIILNFWKYKKSFFYILIPLFIISFFSTHLFPKKNIVQVRLVDPFLINLNVYPLETLYNIELDLASLHLEKIIAKTTREKFNYNLHFFRNNLMAHNNLIDFSKMNDEQYKLYDYVNKEKISVKIDIRDENIYSLTLPASKNNETFFKEYLIYVHNLSLEKLQTSLIDFENKNLLFLETEQKYIQFLYSSLYENYINSLYEFLRDGTKPFVINAIVQKIDEWESWPVIGMALDRDYSEIIKDEYFDFANNIYEMPYESDILFKK